MSVLNILIRYFLRECEKADRSGKNSIICPLKKLCGCKKNKPLKREGIDCLCFLVSDEEKELRETITDIMKECHSIQCEFNINSKELLLTWADIRYDLPFDD
jgi:hypothetical protein